MNEYLASLLRHCFTALASLGVLLAGKGFIAPADASAVDAAGATVGAGLVVILTAIIGRMLLTLLGKLKISGIPGSMDKVPGWALLLGMSMLAGTVGLCLPACSQAGQIQYIPIRGTIFTDYGTVGYSSKAGLDLEVDATSKK